MPAPPAAARQPPLHLSGLHFSFLSSVAGVQQGGLGLQRRLAKVFPLGAAHRQEGVQQRLSAERRRQCASKLCTNGEVGAAKKGNI